MLESRKKDIKDETAWSKCRETIECVFTALSPFSKNFLNYRNKCTIGTYLLAVFVSDG